MSERPPSERAPSERAELRDDLDRESARWVRELATLYAPPAPSPAQRAAFDARLRERIERRRRQRALVPALAAAALAATVVWAVAPRVLQTRAPEAPAARVAARPSEAAWEARLLYTDAYGDTYVDASYTDSSAAGAAASADRAELPDDYAAIDSLFFGG
jgi:hypothetical protein